MKILTRKQNRACERQMWFISGMRHEAFHNKNPQRGVRLMKAGEKLRKFHESCAVENRI